VRNVLGVKRYQVSRCERFVVGHTSLLQVRLGLTSPKVGLGIIASSGLPFRPSSPAICTPAALVKNAQLPVIRAVKRISHKANRKLSINPDDPIFAPK
jgi:hypothetical protein